MFEREIGEGRVALELGEAVTHQVRGHLAALAGLNVRKQPVQRRDVRGQHDIHHAFRRVLLRDDEVWTHSRTFDSGVCLYAPRLK
jgi:hypothetical protein